MKIVIWKVPKFNCSIWVKIQRWYSLCRKQPADRHTQYESKIRDINTLRFIYSAFTPLEKVFRKNNIIIPSLLSTFPVPVSSNKVPWQFKRTKTQTIICCPLESFWQCFNIRKTKDTHQPTYVLSHLWLCDPMDCSLPGSSAHGIIWARILEWIAISFFRGSSWPKDQTLIFYIVRWILYHYLPRKQKHT